MLKKLLLFLIIIASLSGQTFAENKTIDSLQILLKNYDKKRLELGSQPYTILDSAKVNLLVILCDELRVSGNNLDGIKYGNIGLVLAQKINFKKGVSSCYYRIGNIYFSQSNYLMALEYYKHSLNIDEKLNDKRGISMRYTNIGHIYEVQSNYPKALEYYTKALKIVEVLGDKPMISNCYNNIGNIYMSQSNFIKAMEYYRKSLKIEEKLGEKNGIAICYGNIASCYGYQTNYTKALEYIIQSLKIYEELGNKDGIAGCYSVIGNVYYYQSNYPKALEHFIKTLKIVEEIGNKSEVLRILVSISEMNNFLKNYACAKQQAQKAISLSNEIVEIENMRLAYEQLANAESGLGNFKAAYLNHKKFKQLNDSIFNIENSKQLSDIKTNYEVDKKETELNAANKINVAKKEAQIKQQKLLRNSFIGGFVLVLLIAVGIYRSLQQNRKAKAIITKQKQIVEHQKQELTDSIEYALHIQQSILPDKKLMQEHFPNSYILYKPKDIVSGDFYAFHNIHYSNQQINTSAYQHIIGVADCTGHGVPGALMSMLGSNILHQIINEKKIYKPSEILYHLNNDITASLKQNENQGNDGMDISLCNLTRKSTGDSSQLELNEKGVMLQYSAAYRPLYIIKNNLLTEIKANKFPIGGQQTEERIFTNHEIELQQGDTFYIFSDGYADQFGGEKGKKLTTTKFKEMLLSIQHLSMQKQETYLDNFIENWKGNLEQVDDICVIGVRI